MQVNIRAQDLCLTGSLHSHAERRTRFALTRFCDRIQHVVMRLSDVKQLRGGLNKRCHLQVVMADLPDVVVEATEADFYTAINRATDRAGRNVVLRLHGSRSCSASDARPYRMHRIHSTYLTNQIEITNNEQS